MTPRMAARRFMMTFSSARSRTSTVTAAVETRAGDDGIPVPYAAVIEGPWSEALSASIAADLGIPAERQTWKEQDNEI